MFSYTKEQESFEINGKKVGGLPGEHPTMLVGSIFYEGQFSSPKESREEVKERVSRHQELADLISLNSIVDVFIYEEEEIKWKVDFALDNIEGTFSLDMPESEVRIKTLEYLEEVGGLDRVIYNSLNLGATEEEIETLKNHTPKGAVLLGYNPQNNNTQGRLDMIKNGGKLFEKGILQYAQDIGIDITLLDTAATPFGEGASETLRSIPVFKSEFGLPVGCAMHNTVEAWLWLNEYENKKELLPTLDSAIDGLPLILGADFVYYGPIENAELEFPTAAMVDKLVAEGAETYFGTEIDEEHPFYKL